MSCNLKAIRDGTQAHGQKKLQQLRCRQVRFFVFGLDSIKHFRLMTYGADTKVSFWARSPFKSGLAGSTSHGGNGFRAES